MTITPHALAGAAIGSKIHSYWLVAVLALASHYILDMIPHKEYDTGDLDRRVFGKGMIIDLGKIALDFSVALVLGFFLTKDRADMGYVFAGMFFGILPDILTYLKILLRFPLPRFMQDFHVKIHFLNKREIPDWIKVSSQVVVAVVSIIILIK